jgi:uncharacterized protein (TIGR04255 family)
MTGDSRVKFNNPPVIEAWIEFRFSFKDEIPSWDELKAQAFVTESFEGRFHVHAFSGRTEFTISASEGRPALTQPKMIFERVRATNADEDRYVQVGRDTLIWNLLRKEKDWPDYPSLRDEAMDAYDKFINFMHPTGLRLVALHYRDLVPIPLTSDQRVELNDYFNIYPAVPKASFGDVTNVMIALRMPISYSSGPLDLRIQSDTSPRPEETNIARFRLDWHIYPSNPITTLERGNITGWLDQAHDDILKAFIAFFTPKGLDLFK